VHNPHIKAHAICLLPFIHLLISIRCLNSHGRFRTFSTVFIHDTPDIGPPLDPALCAVHFLPCATTTARCSTLPLPLCAHPHPFDHLLTYIASYWPLRLTVHMLSSQVPWSFAEPDLLLLSYSLINQTRSSTDFWWHYHSSSVIYLSIPVRV